MTMQDNQNVFFSIIVPAFNVEKYIRRAISSILNQSFKDFQLIVVNDGSTDNTLNIINEFSNENSKITVINHLKNESLHMVRLNGVAAATGKYIVFLDGDDYFAENAFAELYKSIQENPGYDIYEYGHIRQPSGDIVFPALLDSNRFLLFFGRENSPWQSMCNKVFLSTLIKKAFASMEQVYITNIEDLYESIVVAFYTDRIFIIKKVIMNYQIGSGVSTTYRDYNKTIEYLDSVKRVVDLVKLFLSRHELNISCDDFEYRILEFAAHHYIRSQKDTDDLKKLFSLLPEFFNVRIIIEYLVSVEESYKKLSISRKEILSSKDYRIGRTLLKPMRMLKRLFKIQ